MVIGQLAKNASKLAGLLDALSRKHPEWTAERNDVGNLMLCDVHGEYKGYVDLLNGEMELE